MKCLVTGATGFLGTNLVHELHKQGWDIRALGLPERVIAWRGIYPQFVVSGISFLPWRLISQPQ